VRELRTLFGLWAGLPSGLPLSEQEQVDSLVEEAGSILARLDPEMGGSERGPSVDPSRVERGPSVDPSHGERETSEFPAISESPTLPTEEELESVSAQLNTTHIGTQPTRRAKSRKD